MADTSVLDMDGMTIGGLKVVGRLGQGGMGSVYKARDEALDRFVAIKVLAPALQADPICVERFHREAKSIASLRHPNLMHIYSVGQEKGAHYFTMEYIEGEPLSRYRRDRRPLELEETLRIAGQVLSALHKVHRAAVIHRDLKPGNIMIDSDGRAILVDFGLAKDSGKLDLTTTGTIMGTPDYMSPEQIEGESMGPYTDTYALSIVIYELLTNIKPFRRKSAILTMRAHCEESPPPLSQHRPDLPARLTDIIALAMARRPGDRYQSALEFARALANVCATPELHKLACIAAGLGTAETLVSEPSSSGMAKSAGGQSSIGRGAAGTGVRQLSALNVPTVKTPTGPPRRKGGKKKAVRRKNRERKRKRYLAIAMAVLLALVLVGAIIKRRTRIYTERYRPAGHQGTVAGVSQPKFRILLKNGKVIDGYLQAATRETWTLRRRDTEKSVAVPVSEIRIARPLAKWPPQPQLPAGGRLRRRPLFHRRLGTRPLPDRVGKIAKASSLARIASASRCRYRLGRDSGACRGQRNPGG